MKHNKKKLITEKKQRIILFILLADVKTQKTKTLQI